MIIENLQAENEHLKENVSDLESKFNSLKIKQNKFDQYSRRNNIEVSGIADSVEDSCLEENIIFVFSSIGIDVKSNDIKASNRTGKSRNSSKKTIIRFTYRKFAKQALYK